MTESVTLLPELKHRGRCRACGGEIGFIAPRPGRWAAVDPEPFRLGRWILLGDGVKAVSIFDARLRPSSDFDEKYPGPRFLDHARTCSAPGMRSADWLGERVFSGAVVDPYRERRREAVFRAERTRYRGV